MHCFGHFIYICFAAVFLCVRRQSKTSCRWKWRLSVVFKLLGVLFAFWDWPVGKPCLTQRSISWRPCWARGTQAVSLWAFSLGPRPQITKNTKALNIAFNAKTSVKWEKMFDMILFYAAVFHKMWFPKPEARHSQKGTVLKPSIPDGTCELLIAIELCVSKQSRLPCHRWSWAIVCVSRPQ